MLEIFLSSAGIAFVTLFPLVNPIGAIPVFISLSTDFEPDYRAQQARKTAINVIIILIVFFAIGELLLQFFGISIYVLKIAGGLIVAHTAWEMVTSKSKLSSEENTESHSKTDISFTPLAIPMLSGPGSIGAVISLSSHQKDILSYTGASAGIILIGIVSYICLYLAMPLFKLLGKTGIGVLNRIMGFFILAIAVGFITEGLKAVFQIK
jgi:multiple antibiotic resistance protein